MTTSILDASLAAVRRFAPADRHAALQRPLDGRFHLRDKLSSGLAKATTPAELAAAMESTDVVARSLSLLVLCELDPALAEKLLLEAVAAFEHEQRERVVKVLCELPEEHALSMARYYELDASDVTTAARGVASRFTPALYNTFHGITAAMENQQEAQRLMAELMPPKEIALPAELASEGLLEDVRFRAMPLADFLGLVKANEVPWPANAKYARRPDLVTTPQKIALLTQIMDDVAGVNLEGLNEWLIEGLATAKAKEVDALLARILRTHAALERGIAAIKALCGRKGPVARAALVERIEVSSAGEPTELALRYANLAAAGLVTLDSNDVDALARFLTPEAARTPIGRAVGQGALVTLSGVPLKKWEATAERWGTLAVALLRGPLDDGARRMLNKLPEALLTKLLSALTKSAARAVTVPSSPRWLERYDAGEHEAVWREMREAGIAALTIDEAGAVATRTMDRVRKEILRVVAILKDDDYRFGLEGPVGDPSKTRIKDLAAIEKSLGGPVPLSFRAFHMAMGTVDLSPDPDAMSSTTFQKLEWLDPLQVAPISVTRDLAAKEVTRTKKAWVEALRLPPDLFFAMSPDRKGRHDSEEDEPYMLEAFEQGADGLVRQGSREPVPFVDYLRTTLANGGFAKLDKHEHAAEARERLAKGRILF